MKAVLCFLIFTWNWKVEIMFATVFLKRYILVISYHRLQHRGQEREFLSLRWALFYCRRCCSTPWLYRSKGLIVCLTMLVSGQSVVYWSRRFDCSIASQVTRLKVYLQWEGVLYKITSKCGKEYIGGTGRRRIKELERDLQACLFSELGSFRTRLWNRTGSCLEPG